MSAIAHMVAQATRERPAPTEPMVITYTVERTYRPVGRTRDMLAFLRERGTATTREIADAGGVSVRRLSQTFEPAVKAGAVRYVGNATWEWIK